MTQSAPFEAVRKSSVVANSRSRSRAWCVMGASLAFVSGAVSQGPSWNQVSMTGPGYFMSTPPRMAYDSQRGRTVLVMFVTGETWEWDRTAWSLVSSTGPAPRTRHALAYDSQRGRTVLFGGRANGGGLLGDTWEWDGSAWSLAASTGPAARAGHAMAYDSRRGRTVLFGGGLTVPFADT